MRILYVNWIDYTDVARRGGGVSSYQRHLVEALGARRDVRAVFLSSGTAYDLRASAPARWLKLMGGAKPRYALVNSGVLAPAHASFGAAAQLSDAATEETFYDFMAQTGPYDVVHFNNLEGLPASVLHLKKRFSTTKVIFSLHNYYPFCSQVNLWHQERENCRDDAQGMKCAHCLKSPWDAPKTRHAYSVNEALRRTIGAQGAAIISRGALRLGGLLRAPSPRSSAAPPSSGAKFMERRAVMTEALNACDAVLCVSERVRQIALRFGLRPKIARTVYIGIPDAPQYNRSPARPLLQSDGTLHLGYVGYMRRDKGFYFLIDTLAQLPAPSAARLHLTVAAQRGERGVMRAMHALRPRLAGLTYHNGYTPAALDRILADVRLGVIPVLWEDNLPQTASEMHSRKIPLLCSDLGGAHELGAAESFVFPAGQSAAFLQRIEAILEGKIHADDYWKTAKAPVTMHEHTETLLQLYAAP